MKTPAIPLPESYALICVVYMPNFSLSLLNFGKDNVLTAFLLVQLESSLFSTSYALNYRAVSFLVLLHTVKQYKYTYVQYFVPRTWLNIAIGILNFLLRASLMLL